MDPQNQPAPNPYGQSQFGDGASPVDNGVPVPRTPSASELPAPYAPQVPPAIPPAPPVSTAPADSSQQFVNPSFQPITPPPTPAQQAANTWTPPAGGMPPAPQPPEIPQQPALPAPRPQFQGFQSQVPQALPQQPFNPQQPGMNVPLTPLPEPGRRMKILKIAIGAVVAIVLLGTIALIIKGMSGGVRYNVSTFKTATLKSDEFSPSFSFKYPAEMSQTTKTSSTISLEHNTKEHRYSELTAEGYYVGEGQIAELKGQVKSQFTTAKGTIYDAFIDAIKKASPSQGAKDFKVGTFKSYTSPGVKEGLIADFTYQEKNEKGKGYVGVKGRMVVAFGKAYFYTIEVEAVDNVWVHNDAAFQAVLDSLEIDK